MDDGLHWQRLNLNFPVVPINDLIIQDNDLVAVTEGILDFIDSVCFKFRYRQQK